MGETVLPKEWHRSITSGVGWDSENCLSANTWMSFPLFPPHSLIALAYMPPHTGSSLTPAVLKQGWLCSLKRYVVESGIFVVVAPWERCSLHLAGACSASYSAQEGPHSKEVSGSQMSTHRVPLWLLSLQSRRPDNPHLNIPSWEADATLSTSRTTPLLLPTTAGGRHCFIIHLVQTEGPRDREVKHFAKVTLPGSGNGGVQTGRPSL